MSVLFLFQARVLRGDPAWIGWLLDLGLLAAVLAFFVWAPWELLHRRVAARDILPGSVFTILCFVGLRLISSLRPESGGKRSCLCLRARAELQ